MIKIEKMESQKLGKPLILHFLHFIVTSASLPPSILLWLLNHSSRWCEVIINCLSPRIIRWLNNILFLLISLMFLTFHIDLFYFLLPLEPNLRSVSNLLILRDLKLFSCVRFWDTFPKDVSMSDNEFQTPVFLDHFTKHFPTQITYVVTGRWFRPSEWKYCPVGFHMYGAHLALHSHLFGWFVSMKSFLAAPKKTGIFVKDATWALPT